MSSHLRAFAVRPLCNLLTVFAASHPPSYWRDGTALRFPRSCPNGGINALHLVAFEAGPSCALLVLLSPEKLTLDVTAIFCSLICWRHECEAIRNTKKDTTLSVGCHSACSLSTIQGLPGPSPCIDLQHAFPLLYEAADLFPAS